METSNHHLRIDFDLQVTDLEADLSKLENLVQEICRRFEVNNAAIDISIVDDAQIIEVHRRFLQKDTTTDVISFDLSDDLEAGKTFQLVVNAEMARRQAQKRGHGAEAELALYITHGMLHNLGFDDIEPDQAKKMHETEDEILQQHGFGIIYHRNEIQD